MALKVEKGVLTSPGSTGNQTVSLADTGFGTVKALILWATYATAEADTGADGIMSVGFGSYRASTAAQWCIGYFDDDAAGTSACAQSHTSTSILRGLSDATPTLDYDVALVSLGNAQFVINWTDLPGTASIKVHYLALGGADITDALVSTYDLSTAAGTQDVTVATGFGNPDLLLATVAVGNTTEGDGTGSANMGLGVGIDDANEQHSYWQNRNGRPSMETSVHQTATFLAMINTDAALVFNTELSATGSWPTDGFQVNKLTAPGAAVRVGYLALKGTFTAVVGTNTAPTAAPTVTQDLAVGQTPRGAIFFHNTIPANAAQDNSHADLGLFGLGATDGTNEGWAGVGQDDANASSVAHRHHSESKSVKMFTPSASGTLASEADASINGTNIRLSWADTDTVAREYCYVLLGDGVSDQPLDAQPGSFTLTGTAATLVAGLAVLADPASYAVTGANATLAAGRVFSAEPGAFVVTGTDATTAVGRVVTASPGAYLVTGAVADLVYGVPGAYTLGADPGVFSVTGASAATVTGRTLVASPGAHVVSGFQADLVPLIEAVLDAQPGSFVVTGAPVSFDEATFAAGEPGYIADYGRGRIDRTLVGRIG